MIINGKGLSENILSQLQSEIRILVNKGIFPKIAIITLGREESWEFYIKQKLKKAKELGIQTQLINLTNENQEELIKIVSELNNNKSFHGIIVQRPMPNAINKEKIVDAIDPNKDIDGFSKFSKFESPIWLAVREIIENISDKKGDDFRKWLKAKRVVVVGKGETGGKPVISGFEKIGISPDVVDKKTENKDDIIKKGDIVISAVGKERVVGKELVKKGVILIGIGTHKGTDGKLHGDYVEKEIKNKAAYYTTTPGGIGPINLAFLFKNLIDSAMLA